jgi:hypothetical protein
MRLGSATDRVFDTSPRGSAAERGSCRIADKHEAPD